MGSLNYHHLRYFWSVAHEGSLTAAARSLRLSQSALSVQIQKLEDELGHQLFERRGRRLHLTEVGRIALDHADAIFATGDDLLATLDAHTGSRAMVLRAGALATLSRNFQFSFFEPMLGRADFELRIVSGVFDDLLVALREHRLDVVLANRFAPREEGSSWVSHRIAEQAVSLVGPSHHRGKHRSLRAWLAQEPLIVPPHDSSIRIGFDALVDRLGISPRVVAEVDDMAMLRLVARSGVGLAVVPPIVVTHELEEGRLVELHRIPDLEETFYAITLPRRFPHPLVQELVSRNPANPST
ncbi:MAG: LysR family transcriptional regulator [Myxococcota bacterium]